MSTDHSAGATLPVEPCLECGHAKIGEVVGDTTTCMWLLHDYFFGDAQYCECVAPAH